MWVFLRPPIPNIPLPSRLRYLQLSQLIHLSHSLWNVWDIRFEINEQDKQHVLENDQKDDFWSHFFRVCFQSDLLAPLHKEFQESRRSYVENDRVEDDYGEDDQVEEQRLNVRGDTLRGEIAELVIVGVRLVDLALDH